MTTAAMTIIVMSESSLLTGLQTGLNLSKQIHLVGKRFRLKIHQNNQFLLFVDSSVSIRDLHQKKLVLVLLQM